MDTKRRENKGKKVSSLFGCFGNYCFSECKQGKDFMFNEEKNGGDADAEMETDS